MEKNETDIEFQRKFIQLKQKYDVYQAESDLLQAKGPEDSIKKRILPTMLLGVLTGIFTVFFGNDGEKIIIVVIGGILTIVVFLVATQIDNQSEKKREVKLTQLNEKFALDYGCPACGASYMGISWEFLQSAGKCPFCQRAF